MRFLSGVFTTYIKGKDMCKNNKIILNRYEETIIQKTKKIRQNKILFYGSSTFALWGNQMLIDMLPYDVVNNGFGGSTAEEALYYYDRMVRPFCPEALVYYEGDNDSEFDFSAQEILTRFFQLFDWVRTDFENIPIICLAVKYSPSREKTYQKRNQINEELKKYIDNNSGMFFVDTNLISMNADKTYRKENFMDDLLHFNSTGNKELSILIKEKLDILKASNII